MNKKTLLSATLALIVLFIGSYSLLRASSLGLIYNIDNQNNGILTAAVDNYVLMSSSAAPSGVAWINPLTVLPPRAFATSTRLIATSTGAVGFQISATRDAIVNYAVSIVTTATIGGASEGYETLEVAPTNSATPGDWFEIGSRCRNGQTITLAVALQSAQTTGCNLSGIVPAGYYAKLRSVNVSGTPTYSYISGQEVQL